MNSPLPSPHLPATVAPARGPQPFAPTAPAGVVHATLPRVGGGLLAHCAELAGAATTGSIGKRKNRSPWGFGGTGGSARWQRSSLPAWTGRQHCQLCRQSQHRVRAQSSIHVGLLRRILQRVRLPFQGPRILLRGKRPRWHGAQGGTRRVPAARVTDARALAASAPDRQSPRRCRHVYTETPAVA